VVSVTHEIVHLVGVERAADELGEPGAGTARDEGYNLFRRYQPLLLQYFSDCGNSGMHLINKVSAELLVVRENRFRAANRNLLLDDMSVGEMADIVQKTGREQYPAVVVVKPEPVILKAERKGAGQHALQNQLHEVIDSNGVLKAGVRGARVYLLRKRELPYPFKTKKRGV